MTTNEQSGGAGYGKVKKSFQTGGASGWAKHCGDTKDHQLSNRLERRSAKQSLKSGGGGGGNRIKRKSTRPPTRRHLLDKLNHIDAELAQRAKDIGAHKAKKPGCKCYLYCSDRWLDKYYAENRAKIIREFEKHGYQAP